MGLDISAYRNIQPATPSDLGADGQPLTDDFMYVYPGDFPERVQDLPEGYYRCARRSRDSLGFRAGSYGGYSRWRNILARIAGYHTPAEDETEAHVEAAWRATSGPFWELINFSDCEGCIGPTVAQKLLADFIQFDEQALQEGDYFYEVYRNFTHAMVLASENGVVVFH